tara:strand:+ start:113 stop:346 length:234 start_codon:yes stop_codon:yes gene_type:complete
MGLIKEVGTAPPKGSITSKLRGNTSMAIVPQKLSVHDTDFLMKMFLRSNIQGNEIDQAHTVFQKLKAIHKGNIENES